MPDSDLELAVLRLAWRLESLDKWREEVDRQLGVLEDQVDGLTTQEEIAAAVSERLHAGEPLPTRPQILESWPARIGALVAGALVVADALRGLIS